MEKSGSILVIIPGALGDVINTVPALKALRSHYPGARIQAAGSMEWMEVILAAGLADEIHDMEIPGFHSLFTETSPQDERIKNFLDQFELIISWLRDREGIMERNLALMGKRTVFFREKFPSPPGSLPASILLSQPVRDLGIHDLPAWPELDLSNSCLKRIPHTTGDERAYMVVHPGSGSRSKCWPAERFAEVAERIAHEFNLKVLLLQGPADQDSSGMFQQKSRYQHSLIKDLPIMDVACLLKSASLYIGNDSGISHMAAALRVPSLLIFGPTDPGVWGPRQPWSRTVSATVECAPCDDETRRKCKDRKCLLDISIEDVYAKAVELIRESM
jgi:ADP-heptose:LPS heptosyltransferase